MLRVAILTILLGFSLHMRAQDAQFSQSFSNPMYLNPAFAGYDGCPTIRTAYRNQWPNISGNFQTVNISYDQMVGKRHGLAINYQYDNAANRLVGHALSVSYAPAFRLFKKQLTISPAIELGWRFRRLDTSELTFGDMIDPRYGFVYNSQTSNFNGERHIFDMSTGILLTFKGLVFGTAFHHVTQPNEGFANNYSPLPVKISSHVNYTFQITDRFRLAPSLIYLHQQDFNLFLPSLSFYVYGARAGLAYRINLHSPSAIIFQVGYQGKGFKVGYSYDLGISSSANNTGGSHEVSLGYVFNCKKKEFRKGVSQINF